MDDLGGEFCACAAHGVAEGDCSAVDVYFFGVESEFSCYEYGYGGEGFVDFEEVDVVEGESGHFDCFWNGYELCRSQVFGAVGGDVVTEVDFSPASFIMTMADAPSLI